MKIRIAFHRELGRRIALNTCLLLSACCILVISCQKAETLAPQAEFSWYAPSDFPALKYNLENNPWTEKGFELGRSLFYDPIFSRDNSVACGDCHQPFTAFADPAHGLSVGIEGRIGIRNAPMIANMGYLEKFFWDGGVGHLDFVPVNAIENPLEMDENIIQVLHKLNQDESYKKRFKEVFGVEEIQSQQVFFAFSQFMLRLVSDQSPYDAFRRNQRVATEDEIAGAQLFETHCASCHEGVLFTDQSFRNNGLDSSFENDLGRARITELEQDEGLFRVPSLRNVELTAPYMHDGRFASLEVVLDHYSDGIVSSASLDENLPVGGFQFTEKEREQIIEFLTSLTDRAFVSNPKFFDPN